MKLAASLLVVLALAPAAHAECAIPRWIGTPSGTTIPEHGSLYMFDQGYAADEPVEFADGVPHRWEKVRISDDVVRIDYAAGLASTVAVTVRDEPYAYTVDAAWTPPSRAPRVLQYWHQVSAWTCSYTDSWMIQVDQPTAAFRVRWTQGAFGGEIDAALVGTTFEYIEPARVGEDGRSVIELGKHDCVPGATLRPEALAAGGRLRLFAIRFDGSEAEVTGLPAAMHTGMLRVSDAGVDGAFGYQLAVAAPPAAPLSTNENSGHALLLLAAIGVGVLFFAMLLVGRKRAPTPIQL